MLAAGLSAAAAAVECPGLAPGKAVGAQEGSSYTLKNEVLEASFEWKNGGVEFGGNLDGVKLTQAALTAEIGGIGSIFVAIALFFFAFSSIFGNYYYGEANIRFITKSRAALNIYRLIVGAMVMGGAMMSLKTVWSLADITMALMTLCNLVALVLLGRQAMLLLDDYRAQRRGGADPIFKKNSIKELASNDNIECW